MSSPDAGTRPITDEMMGDTEGSPMKRMRVKGGFAPEETRAGLRASSRLAPTALKTAWSSDAVTAHLPRDNPGEPADVFCIRFSPDDALVAAGCGDGIVRIYNADDGGLVSSLCDERLILPTTCLRFRPQGSSAATKNVLVEANSDGTVKHWHVPSAKCLHTITEENNQVYALDYDVDGGRLATAGRDCHIRVYDDATKQVALTLASSLDRAPSFPGETVHSGHSNRIFGLRFGVQRDMLLSGGWDNTVQLWDVRTQAATLSIFGPHVCGDALDLMGNYILTGSWRPADQLQLWDIRTSGLVCTFPWPSQGRGSEPCQVYAAQFSRHDQGGTVVAGGSGANEVRAFSVATRKAVAALTLPKGVYGLDLSCDGRRIATAAGDHHVRVLEMP